MRRLKICQDGCAGVTVVSNRFIDEFMPQANDAQLKIYLYLLRAVSAGLPLDISEIADAFNHTEKDVMRALKYWEKRGVLLLTEKDNLCVAPALNIPMEDLAAAIAVVKQELAAE